MITKSEAGQRADAARVAAGISWEQVAEAADAPLIWTIAAVLGEHPMSPEQAAGVGDLLGLDPEVTDLFTRQPSRGPQTPALPTDPTMYRFYEALMVYGPALKEWIHEEFGDGIMSAINFGIEVEKIPDPAGDRVKVTFNGKFLPYQWS